MPDPETNDRKECITAGQKIFKPPRKDLHCWIKPKSDALTDDPSDRRKPDKFFYLLMPCSYSIINCTIALNQFVTTAGDPGVTTYAMLCRTFPTEKFLRWIADSRFALIALACT